MSLPVWLANLVRAVDTEYDRRIRRASKIEAYDVDGTVHTHAASDDHTEESLEEDEGVEIVNVPRGTRIAPAAAISSGEHEIN